MRTPQAAPDKQTNHPSKEKTMSKFRVRSGQPDGVDGWLVCDTDDWPIHLAKTFTEAIHYAHRKARRKGARQ